ncbi:MAG: aminotransferase class V-fold PLP-dependent enzyme [Bacteroidetes bacterium]|nr:aminotransferase class V-fold PLP-dependent enzyme [Bacteroidota bacterium]
MKTLAHLKSQFLLNPDITYLNFGSFGACPKPIFENYLNWQYELETEPVQFIAINGLVYMKQARQALAEYINCDSDDLVFVPNPTHAFNIVARNLNLNEGDEILSTNLEYGAMDRTWKYYCGLHKAQYIRQPISLPIQSKEEIIEQFFKGYTVNTRAIFISHITSSTGLVLPVNEICDKAKELGLITIVDGAHAPGHVMLDLKQLKADFYTGACHKWMLTPKGSSFLYAHKKYQNDLDPLIISWGYESDNPSASRFIDYHQFNGTRDFSAYLTIPKAIEFMNENNWDDVRSKCRKLVNENAVRFCDLLGTQPISPITDEFLGQLFSIPILTSEPEQLYKLLFNKYKIEIPVTRGNGRFYLRYSINAFNSQADLDTLYSALSEIISATSLLQIPPSKK